MRHSWLLTIVIIAIVAGGPAVPARAAVAEDAQPLGFWESIETSSGGIGAALELRADGNLRHCTVVLVEIDYRLEGDHVILSDPSGTDQGPGATLGDNVMILTDADGSTLEKSRFRAPRGGGSPILGDWFYSYQGQATAFERYTADGKVSFRLPLRIETGTYQLDGDRLRVTLDGQDQEWLWSVEGDELLVGPRGKQSRYRRRRRPGISCTRKTGVSSSPSLYRVSSARASSRGFAGDASIHQGPSPGGASPAAEARSLPNRRYLSRRGPAGYQLPAKARNISEEDIR